jgi:nitrite reductase/ring-hydroxylating ferredoxin subunit
MTQFVEVARLDHIIGGAAAVVTVGETAVALFDVDGRLYAVEDACMRCGSSIAAGLLAGAEITCNGCSWRYNVTTGCVKEVPALRVNTFEVRTVGARVMVAASGSADQHK